MRRFVSKSTLQLCTGLLQIPIPPSPNLVTELQSIRLGLEYDPLPTGAKVGLSPVSLIPDMQGGWGRERASTLRELPRGGSDKVQKLRGSVADHLADLPYFTGKEMGTWQGGSNLPNAARGGRVWSELPLQKPPSASPLPTGDGGSGGLLSSAGH